jgi:DNA mismatch repair ATPase MutS
MSKKIRGMNKANLKTSTAKRWAEIASNPDNDGKLVLMLSGDNYVLLGEDATTAAEALSLPLDGIGDAMFSFPRTEVASYAARLRDAGLRVLICGHQENAHAKKSFWRARVEVIMGDRKTSNLMSRAGLGITSVGTKELLTLNYTPGEDVDTERVKAGMENLISIADRDKSEFIISSYKLLALELITP